MMGKEHGPWRQVKLSCWPGCGSSIEDRHRKNNVAIFAAQGRLEQCCGSYVVPQSEDNLGSGKDDGSTFQMPTADTDEVIAMYQEPFHTCINTCSPHIIPYYHDNYFTHWGMEWFNIVIFEKWVGVWQVANWGRISVQRKSREKGTWCESSYRGIHSGWCVSDVCQGQWWRGNGSKEGGCKHHQLTGGW